MSLKTECPMCQGKGIIEIKDKKQESCKMMGLYRGWGITVSNRFRFLDQALWFASWSENPVNIQIIGQRGIK